MSKSQINKLGRTIRGKLRDNVPLTVEEINRLQEYRTSFKEDLSEVFKTVAELSRKERKDNIVSFRIKRIESILSKIKREPTMALGNMGDIAGCRVIVYSQPTLLNLVASINEAFEVENFNDYVSKPKEDGYKGYHLYVKSPVNEHKLIEIQLRFITTHKWASLVEIIDILYDLKLKEGQKNEDLQEFIYIISLDKDKITIDQKKRIIDIDNKFKIYSRLNEVFLKNHISIRRKWLKISETLENYYFIFEVDEEKKSDILSFICYEEAEIKYFEMFKTNRNSNFVLAYIEKPNYKNICIAYSSYMLIKHDYLEDYWNSFAKDIIECDNKREKVVYSDFIKRNFEDLKVQLEEELKEVSVYLKSLDPNETKINGVKEWVNELMDMKSGLDKKNEELLKLVNAKQKKSGWSRFLS
jgi:ppGpp synthetase/RelA/SpoT-type nucleotidyltranferase